MKAQLNKNKANSVAKERGQSIISNMRNLELDLTSSRNRGAAGSTVMNNRTT